MHMNILSMWLVFLGRHIIITVTVLCVSTQQNNLNGGSYYVCVLE